jgi:predicted ATPase
MEQMLDTMLEDSREYFEREGIGLRDESNRSGFDPVSSPYFVWAYYFEKREAYGSEIKRAEARLWYREPVYKDESRRIEVTSGAEIFQIGKESRLREITKEAYSIERFLDAGLRQAVKDCIAAAQQVLAKY